MNLIVAKELAQGWDTVILFNETTGKGRDKQNILMSVFFPRIAKKTDPKWPNMPPASHQFPEYTVKAFSCVTLENVNKSYPWWDKLLHSMDNLVPNSARVTIATGETHSRLVFKGEDKVNFESAPDAWRRSVENKTKDMKYILVKGEWIPQLYFHWKQAQVRNEKIKELLRNAQGIDEINSVFKDYLIEIPAEEIVEPEQFYFDKEGTVQANKPKDEVIEIAAAKRASISPCYTGESLDGLGRASGKRYSKYSYPSLKKRIENGTLTPFQVGVARRLHLI